MNLETLQQMLKSLDPPVAAAIVAALVAIVALVVNSGLQVWKAYLDRDIAREKGQNDRDLAQQKFTSDVQLAERKMALDIQLADRKRRTELAEAVLTDVYRVRSAFSWVRSPFLRGNEGNTRPRTETETEEEANVLNSFFAPIERLNKESELFAKLEAHIPRFQANFGPEAGRPFKELIIAHNKIASASKNLIRFQKQNINNGPLIQRNEAIIWENSEDPDPINPSIATAVAAIEEICRPILSDDAR